MADKKNKKRRNDSREYYEMDFHDYRRSMRKSERRNQRHESHRHLRDVQQGCVDPDDFEDYYDND